MAEGTIGDFDCSICKSKYTSPRQLDCFHVFCAPCLEKLIEGKSEIACPLCKHVVVINKTGIEAFKPYKYDISGEENVEVRICQMCDDTDTYSNCKDCDQIMCRNCHEYHLRHKNFRIHKVERLDIAERKMAEKEVKLCDEHSKNYTLYCKSCNETICEICAKKSHKNHNLMPTKSTADAMRHAIGVAIAGLKSKIPHIATFIEHAKTDELKYHKHITKTRSDLKTSVKNLKDLFCKSVDMRYAQTIAVLDYESNKDKKSIQCFIEETEREAMSLSKLIQFSEDILENGDDSDITKIGSSLCSKIRSYEKSGFHSEISIDIPHYKQGNFSDKQVQDCIGSVERRNNNPIYFHLDLPYTEVSIYPDIVNMTKMHTVALGYNHEYTTVIADRIGNIYLFSLKKCNKINNVWQYCAEIVCTNLKSKRKWTVTSDYEQEHGKTFNVTGIHSEKIFILCSDDLRTANINLKLPCEQETKITLKTEIPDVRGQSACITNDGNILIMSNEKRKIQRMNLNGTLENTISVSDLPTTSYSKPIIMNTQSNNIFVILGNEILCYDMHGDIKNRFRLDDWTEFTAMCQDRHGNVFVSDAAKGRICLFTSDGHYIRDVLLSQDGIKSPKSLCIDSLGNLWVLMPNSISVFSYL